MIINKDKDNVRIAYDLTPDELDTFYRGCGKVSIKLDGNDIIEAQYINAFSPEYKTQGWFSGKSYCPALPDEIINDRHQIKEQKCDDIEYALLVAMDDYISVRCVEKHLMMNKALELYRKKIHQSEAPIKPDAG